MELKGWIVIFGRDGKRGFMTAIDKADLEGFVDDYGFGDGDCEYYNIVIDVPEKIAVKGFVSLPEEPTPVIRST